MRTSMQWMMTGLAVLVAAPLASAAVLDFETADQYTENFRKLAGTANATQTSNGVDNDFVNVTGNTSFVNIYDTTPGETATADAFVGDVTVTVDILLGGGSFGIYLINAENTSQGYLALFNYNNRIRLSEDANPSTNGAGGLNEFDSTAASGVTNSVWAPVTLTYTVDADDHPVLSFKVGTLESGAIPLTGVTAFDSVSVGLRVSPSGSTANIGFDNFNVVGEVPEPTSLALLSAGGLLMARRTRR